MKIYEVCVCVCVCACVWNMYLYIHVCVCVCMRAPILQIKRDSHLSSVIPRLASSTFLTSCSFFLFFFSPSSACCSGYKRINLYHGNNFILLTAILTILLKNKHDKDHYDRNITQLLFSLWCCCADS